jgi:GH24 family phage-related lysozyme (muramidase)
VDYKKKTLDLLKKHEGFTPSVYDDGKGNPTVGYGFNLNAPDTRDLLEQAGYTQDRLNAEGMSEDVASQIKQSLLDREEEKLRSSFGDFYDEIPENKKVALNSLFYNSPALVGPKVRQYVAEGDDLNLAKEIALYSNKNDELGVLKRRLDEASQVKDLSEVSKILTREEKQRLRNILRNSDNENVKREILQQYGTALGLVPAPVKFSKLNPSNR